MAAAQDNLHSLREALGRRLAQRRPNEQPRRRSVEIPERFREGSDDEKDVCAPPRTGGALPLNQSIFGLIAAAGSAAGMEENVNESDEEEGEEAGEEGHREPLSKTVPSLSSASGAGGLDGTVHAKPNVGKPRHRRRSSKSMLVKSLHKLRLKPIRERKSSASAEVDDMMSSSQILAPKPSGGSDREEEAENEALSSAPVLSRILTADAQMRQELRKDESVVSGLASGSAAKKQLSLAEEVQRMFKFEEKQDIIAEYRCRLVTNLDVPGHIFVTKRYICFYAYLPQMAAKTVKSGYISKRGMRDPRYHRFYCELKGHVLNFYEDKVQINYPRSLVDMRRAISAYVAPKERGTGKDDTYFTLEMDKREYHLKADSPESCRDWVHALQQEILNTHNDGGLIKITLPIENILDCEDNPMRGMVFGDSLRIRVIDNDETFAVDEYYFAFDKGGREAIRVLRLMVENHAEQSEVESGSELNSAKQSPNFERPSGGAERIPFHEKVKSTLVPQSPGNRTQSSNSRKSSPERKPGLHIRRRSSEFDAGMSHSRSPKSQTHDAYSSPASPSLVADGGSSTALQSLDESVDDSNAAESQILNRSDVFQATINAPSPQRGADDDRLHRTSQDTARGRPPDQLLGQGQSPSGSGAHSLTEQNVARIAGSDYGVRLRSSVTAMLNPLQTMQGVVGYVGKQSKQGLNSLASQSKSAYGKATGMWVGGARHYGPAAGAPDDAVMDEQDDEQAVVDTQRFREHFAMPESERLIASWHCHAQRTLPIYGKLYLGSTHLCWRPLMARTTKMKLPLKVIETATKGNSYRLGYSGMCVVVGGDEEVFFDFSEHELRDDCVITILQALQRIDPMTQIADSGILSVEEIRAGETAKADHKALQEARRAERMDDEETDQDILAKSMMFDDPRAQARNLKPETPLRITCLTIGSRGDVQPYIALCKRLKEEGHIPRIATHAEFGTWVRKHGIDFEPVEGDPAVLMKLCVENGMFTLSFMKEATLHFRTWIEGLMESAWWACQDSDVIIESPSAMVGVHIAEALQIPYFRAFGMPWTRTRSFPHAFFVPGSKKGGTYNFMTYTLFDTFFWQSTAGQINAWRKRQLGLNATTLSRLGINKVPFLYNFSRHVVKQPLDWSEWVRITGYWFLDEDEDADWSPPADLAAFIAKARADGKKLVYIGFGSITVEDPALLTDTVVKAVMANDLRCVLSKGWSDRLLNRAAAGVPQREEAPLPPEILQIKYSVPHSWLFPLMDAIVHHGGCGTTGASLRAGKPTVIKPFFGDQFFFGSRVEDLGVGVCLKTVSVRKFGRALWMAVNDERMRRKAAWLSEQIRAEDGVGEAVTALYRDLDYARSLVVRKRMGGAGAGGPAGAEAQHEDTAELDLEDEAWTIVGGDGDEPVTPAVLQWDPRSGSIVVEAAAGEAKERSRTAAKDEGRARQS